MVSKSVFPRSFIDAPAFVCGQYRQPTNLEYILEEIIGCSRVYSAVLYDIKQHDIPKSQAAADEDVNTLNLVS
jgi:orotidine-5'-phosphate decarboxylase